MKFYLRPLIFALLVSLTAGGATYVVLDSLSSVSDRRQQEKDVINYNDGFIDGENNIIDQCEKMMDPKLGTTWYECPIPVVDR